MRTKSRAVNEQHTSVQSWLLQELLVLVDKPSTLTFWDNMTRWLPRRWMDFRWSDFSLTEPQYNFIHTQMQEITIEFRRSENMLCKNWKSDTLSICVNSHPLQKLELEWQEEKFTILPKFNILPKSSSSKIKILNMFLHILAYIKWIISKVWNIYLKYIETYWIYIWNIYIWNIYQ